MKYEIIHLSDFHVRNELDYTSLVDKMVDSLIFDSRDISSIVFLCITGDLTQSGQQNQFELFDSFLQELQTKINSNGKTVNILFVPGNHDIQLRIDDSDIRSRRIRDALDNSYVDVDKLITDDLNNMNYFFDFASKYGLFTNNKFICKKEFDLGKEKITFTLLNTAIFSSMKKDDKDIHYIPVKELKNVDLDRNIITLMHHNFEWFDESCQNEVENLCKTSAFYLFGHSHRTEVVQFEKGKGFLTTEINEKDLINSGYSIFTLDIDKNKLELYRVEYDKVEQKFIRKDENKKIFQKIFHSSLNSCNKYFEENSKIDINDKNYQLDDFFTMPLLTIDKINKTINDFDTLIELIEEKKFVAFNGPSGRGKTTLARKLFNKYIEENKMVLFVNDERYITNNPNQSIKNIFKDNYQNRDFNIFNQQHLKNKVLIIDNIRIGKNDSITNFIRESKNKFGAVIFTNDSYFDSRKELLTESGFVDLEKITIEPYTLKQRRKLVEKFAAYYKQDDKIELINKCIESLLVDETFVDLSSPDNLTVLLQRIIEDKFYEERDTKDSFSIVFEKNIYNRIISIIGDSKADDAFTILRKMGYFMFCKEKANYYKISTAEIVTLLNDYRKDWGIEFEVSKFLQFLDESGLMKNENEQYSFIKNSYFAFFIAKEIVDRKNNELDVNNDLTKIINNISFGNYSDILLFIAYFANSCTFFNRIMDSLNTITSNWIEISYDENNHYILKRMIKDGFVLKNNYESKEEYNERRDLQERGHLEKIDEHERNSKCTAEITNIEVNDIIKVIKLLEILAKGLGGYKGQIKVNQREQMLKSINEGLYKLIYKVFEFTDEDYETFYKTITFDIKEKRKEVTAKEIEKRITSILYDCLSTFTLNCLTSVCKIFVSKNSISLVDKLNDYDDKKNAVFNTILFKCVAYERYGNADKFADYLYEIYDELKTYDQKNMVKRIFYLFLVTNSISNFKLEKLCNKLNLQKTKILALNFNTNKISMH